MIKYQISSTLLLLLWKNLLDDGICVEYFILQSFIKSDKLPYYNYLVDFYKRNIEILTVLKKDNMVGINNDGMKGGLGTLIGKNEISKFQIKEFTDLKLWRSKYDDIQY